MKFEVEYVGDDEMQWWHVSCQECDEVYIDGLGLDIADWIEAHECAPPPFRPGLLFPEGEPVVASAKTGREWDQAPTFVHPALLGG